MALSHLDESEPLMWNWCSKSSSSCILVSTLRCLCIYFFLLGCFSNDLECNNSTKENLGILPLRNIWLQSCICIFFSAAQAYSLSCLFNTGLASLAWCYLVAVLCLAIFPTSAVLPCWLTGFGGERLTDILGYFLTNSWPIWRLKKAIRYVYWCCQSTFFPVSCE